MPVVQNGRVLRQNIEGVWVETAAPVSSISQLLTTSTEIALIDPDISAELYILEEYEGDASHPISDDVERTKLDNPSLAPKMFQSIYVRNIKEIGYIDLDSTTSNNVNLNSKFINPNPTKDDTTYAFIHETLTAGPGGVPLSPRDAVVLTYCVRELGQPATFATVQNYLAKYFSQLTDRGQKAFNEFALPLSIILDSSFFARYLTKNIQDGKSFPVNLAKVGNFQYLKYFQNFEDMMRTPTLFTLKNNANFKQIFQPYQNDLLVRLGLNMFRASKLFCNVEGTRSPSNPLKVGANPIDVLNLLKITSLETKSHKNMQNLLTQLYGAATRFSDAQYYSKEKFLAIFCSKTFRSKDGVLAIDWLTQPSPFSTPEVPYSNWDYIRNVLIKQDNWRGYEGTVSNYLNDNFETGMTLQEFAFGLSRLDSATIVRLEDTIGKLRRIFNAFSSKTIYHRPGQTVSNRQLVNLERFLQEFAHNLYNVEDLEIFASENRDYLNGDNQLTDKVLEILDGIEREFIAAFHGSDAEYQNWISEISDQWLDSTLHLDGTYLSLSSYIQSFDHYISVLKFVNYHITTATGSYTIYSHNTFELESIKAWEPMFECLNNMYADATFNRFPHEHKYYDGRVYKLDQAYRFEIDSRGFMAENLGGGDAISSDGRNRAENYQIAAKSHLMNGWAVIHNCLRPTIFQFYDDLIDSPDGTWHGLEVSIGKSTPLLREEWQNPIATAITAGKNLPTPMAFHDVIRYITCNRPIVNDFPLASQAWKDAMGTTTYAQYFGISSLAALDIQERFGLNTQNANSLAPLPSIIETIDDVDYFDPTGFAFSEKVYPHTTRYFLEDWWRNYYNSNDDTLGRSFYDFLGYRPVGQSNTCN